MPFSLAQDLHCHSALSSCCQDAELTPARILDHAVACGQTEVCLTDHLWSEHVPGASRWYVPQGTAHVRQALPLPQADGVRFCFGCETEYLGGDRLALAPGDFALFDFIVIPLNHFHMRGFVRPEDVVTVRQIADLFTRRLTELTTLPLPWHKIGIAHPTCPLMYTQGDVAEVVLAMEEAPLLRAFEKLAGAGAGIELNAHAFPRWQQAREGFLRLYKIAQEAGCRFYCASDAHTVAEMDSPYQALPGVVRALGLDARHQYHIPQ